mgnify:FL=1
MKNKSVGTLYPHLVLEWDTEKNGLLTPFMFTPGSGGKIWWICNMNHRWRASIVSRTKGSKCPYCSGICVIRGKNDLATLRPDIAAEWNDEKNGELKPCNLKIKSNKKYGGNVKMVMSGKLLFLIGQTKIKDVHFVKR